MKIKTGLMSRINIGIESRNQKNFLALNPQVFDSPVYVRMQSLNRSNF